MASHVLDLIAQLNFVLPRDFLLQVEDELEAFANEDHTEPQSHHCDAPSLFFPPLARSFEDLLSRTASRFGMEVSSGQDKSRRRCFIVKHTAASRTKQLPLFGYADFLQIQRPLASADTGEEQTASNDYLHRMRRRLWALRVLRESPDDYRHAAERNAGDSAVDDGTELSTLRAAIDSILQTSALQWEKHSGRTHSQKDAFIGGAPLQGGSTSRDTVVKKRGRGFAEVESISNISNTRHDYSRFAPDAPRRIYFRDNFFHAPWPTAKLRRLREPPVLWRPEWRVGPLDSEVTEFCCGRGNVLSWGVPLQDLSFGEGFEISLRSGPGPSSIKKTELEEADRCDDDFVLSFRRGDKCWHLTAGRRAKFKENLTSKALLDSSQCLSSRHMFWVACLESRTDGKHYIVAGNVPGILTDHFFVAKVGRSTPYSHAGFSYLPTPGKAAFADDCNTEPPTLMLESITVYPHALTGELPFISIQFVDEVKLASLAKHPKNHIAPEVFAKRALPSDREDAEQAEMHILHKPSRTNSKNVEESDIGCSHHFNSWSLAAQRECGLLLMRGDESPEEKLDRRAKRRTESMQAPVASNLLSAPASWEPCTVHMPKFGPFDDSIRHDPLNWDPYSHIEV